MAAAADAAADAAAAADAGELIMIEGNFNPARFKLLFKKNPKEFDDMFASMSPEERFLCVKHTSTCFCYRVPKAAKAEAEMWLNDKFQTITVDVIPSMGDFHSAIKSAQKSMAQNIVICKWAYFLNVMLYNLPFFVAPQPQELDTLAGVISLMVGDDDIVTLAVCAMTNLLDSMHGSKASIMFHIQDHCTIFKRLHGIIKAHSGHSFIVMNCFNALTSMAIIQNTETETRTICCVFSHLTKMFGVALDLMRQRQFFGVINNIFRFLGVTLQIAKQFPVLSFTHAAVSHYTESFVGECINHMYNAKLFLAKGSRDDTDMVVVKKIITSICMVLGELPPMAVTTHDMDALTTLFYDVRQVLADKKISFWVFRLLNNTPSFAPKLQQQTLKLLLCMLVMRLKTRHGESFFEGLLALSSFLHKVRSINQEAYNQISFLLAQDKKGGGDEDTLKDGLYIIIECRLAQMKLSGDIISSAIVLHKDNLRCDVCLQKYYLRLHCSQCKLAKYCSAACQEKHWFQQDHKTWCNTHF